MEHTPHKKENIKHSVESGKETQKEEIPTYMK